MSEITAAFQQGDPCHGGMPSSWGTAVIVSYYHGSDRVETRPMAQCCHCQHMWLFDPKEKGRGFCTRHNGPLCGRKWCREKFERNNKCVGVEQWLENVEAGRDESYAPIIVSVPVAFSGGRIESP